MLEYSAHEAKVKLRREEYLRMVLGLAFLAVCFHIFKTLGHLSVAVKIQLEGLYQIFKAQPENYVRQRYYQQRQNLVKLPL